LNSEREVSFGNSGTSLIWFSRLRDRKNHAVVPAFFLTVMKGDRCETSGERFLFLIMTEKTTLSREFFFFIENEFFSLVLL